MNDLPPVVSTAWLAERCHDPEVKVIDCRFRLGDPDWGYQQYRSGHVPGAYFLDLERDLSSPIKARGGRHPLPDFEKLGQKLGSIGIASPETRVIVYDDARFAFAARLWWLLRYMGHERVALLDGGWKAWESEGRAVNSTIPEPTPAEFIPSLQPDWVVEQQTVQSRKDLEGVVLLDSREGDRYRGEREPIDAVAGHIAGAVNSPWLQVTDEKGYLQSLPALQQLWQAYGKDQEIILYCGSGVTACVNLFSLSLLGYHRLKLYVGGWSDWCAAEALVGHYSSNL